MPTYLGLVHGARGGCGRASVVALRRGDAEPAATVGQHYLEVVLGLLESGRVGLVARAGRVPRSGSVARSSA